MSGTGLTERILNLAPADVRKGGAALDLAIAVGILGAIGVVPAQAIEGILLIGELSLDGSLRPVRGVLPQLDGARARGLAFAVVPAGNAAEAGLATGITVFRAESLAMLLAHLLGERALPKVVRTEFKPEFPPSRFDLADVRGQATARRALEIAAAARGHNLLMMGPQTHFEFCQRSAVATGDRAANRLGTVLGRVTPIYAST